MNENLNLVEILKDCPKGTKLYSPIYGDVELEKVSLDNDIQGYPIKIKIPNLTGMFPVGGFTKDGRINADYSGECTLFPSKDQRDWSKFKPKKPKFDPKTLQPFDKVLVRNIYKDIWRCAFYSHKREPMEGLSGLYKYATSDRFCICCIPYNDDTKHLVGTKDEAPEFYRYWEE